MAILIVFVLLGVAAAVLVISSTAKISTPEEPVNRPQRESAVKLLLQRKKAASAR